MKPLLRDLLSIYWNGKETAGFTVHGLRSPGDVQQAEEGPLLSALGPENKRSVLRGASWEVYLWDIRVDQWPQADAFEDLVEKALCGLVEGGFVVAWIGLEGHFLDPPQLFDSQLMAGGVLAACSRATGFLSAIDLDSPLEALPASALDRLREGSGGLAQAH